MIYNGGCHCGAVRFNVDMTIEKVMECNCSICSKRAHLLSFAPASHFTLEKGENAQTDYQFGKKTLHHMFCKTCGIGSYSTGTAPDGTKTVAVNVRCLDNVDVKHFEVIFYDGKSN